MHMYVHVWLRGAPLPHRSAPPMPCRESTAPAVGAAGCCQEAEDRRARGAGAGAAAGAATGAGVGVVTGAVARAAAEAVSGVARRPTAVQSSFLLALMHSSHSCWSAAACSCSLTSRCRGASRMTLRWIARPVEAGSAASSACAARACGTCVRRVRVARVCGACAAPIRCIWRVLEYYVYTAPRKLACGSPPSSRAPTVGRSGEV